MDGDIEAAAIEQNERATLAHEPAVKLNNLPHGDGDVAVPGMGPYSIGDKYGNSNPSTRPGTAAGSTHVAGPRHSYELPGTPVGVRVNTGHSVTSVGTTRLPNSADRDQGATRASLTVDLGNEMPRRSGTLPVTENRQNERHHINTNGVPAHEQEYDIPLRAGTLPTDKAASATGVKERGEAEDAALDKFLIDHFKNDLFDVIKPAAAPAPASRFLKIFGLDPLGREQKQDKKLKVNVRVSLAALNRMRMRRLQMKLAHQILRMHYYKECSTDWEDLLKEYIAATRDNDYIRTCIHRGIDDPFLVGTEKHVDAAILNATLLDIPEAELHKEGLWATADGDDKRRKFNFVPPVEKEPRAIGGTRMATTRKQKTQLFFQRVLFSIVGGIFLVGPMWLMAVLNAKYVSLISTSVFVFLAGLLAAWKLDDPKTVLSTTAAYAAVLVVFVGTSTAPSPGGGS